MSQPILGQIAKVAMEVPDTSIVRVGDKQVVAVSRDADGCVRLDLGELTPALEAKPQKPKKEKAADGPGLD